MEETIDESGRRLFDQQRYRRFGNANPEHMLLAHWEWMVRNALNPYQALHQFGRQLDPGGKPDWCFAQRYGMTETRLDDGRAIYIGGEYEDSYDPEFCIYNDVIVRGPGDAVALYGYPETSFPPTDFHTATLIDDEIIVIGGLGYLHNRRPGQTPVFSLNTNTYEVSTIGTTGQNPGWVYKHSSVFDPAHRVIVVQGGKEYIGESHPEEVRSNDDVYKLQLRDWQWRRVDACAHQR